MPTSPLGQRLAVPRHWTRSIQAALIHAMALAHYALVGTWARANSGNDEAQHDVRINRLEQEIALFREEVRIKDARLARIPAARRPHFAADDRLAILELRAARGWSLAQTARVFQLTATTIASWGHRLDEQGPAALLRTRVPVNKFPDFVRYLVQRLHTLCPLLGKVKIAQVLARAGLQLGVSTVARMLRQPPCQRPRPRPETMPAASRVTARSPNRVWHVDLTVVPTAGGLWASWLPFALPQCWPFCWWLAVVLDHYSRRAVGFAVFSAQPTSEQVRRLLGRLMGAAGVVPRYLVTDSGIQFTVSFR